VLGVQNGIAVAIAASIVDHLRHSYRPRNSVLVKSAAGHWQPSPVLPGARTEDGLVVYRFASSLYYANANHFLEQTLGFLDSDDPPEWLCIDGNPIPDVDYTGGTVLEQLHDACAAHGVRLVVAELQPGVRRQLERYGTVATVGDDAFFTSVEEVLTAFDTRAPDERDDEGR
jgi:sulfate permease, SulP family